MPFLNWILLHLSEYYNQIFKGTTFANNTRPDQTRIHLHTFKKHWILHFSNKSFSFNIQRKNKKNHTLPLHSDNIFSHLPNTAVPSNTCQYGTRRRVNYLIRILWSAVRAHSVFCADCFGGGIGWVGDRSLVDSQYYWKYSPSLPATLETPGSQAHISCWIRIRTYMIWKLQRCNSIRNRSCTPRDKKTG